MYFRNMMDDLTVFKETTVYLRLDFLRSKILTKCRDSLPLFILLVKSSWFFDGFSLLDRLSPVVISLTYGSGDGFYVCLRGG